MHDIIVSLDTLFVDSMESRPGLEMANEYDDEQFAALLSDIRSDVTKAKQSLETNIRGVDDALEDLFVRGEIYVTGNERSMVNDTRSNVTKAKQSLETKNRVVDDADEALFAIGEISVTGNERSMVSDIRSDVTKAKQSLETKNRGVDDAREDLFVRGEIYITGNERSMVDDIRSNVTKAKQSLKTSIRGVDDALEDLVRGEIYDPFNERSIVTQHQEPDSYLHASNIEIPANIDVPAFTSDASKPALSQSSQIDLCRTCGLKVCNGQFTVLGGLKGQCLHCHILHLDPDPGDASRDTVSSVISELTNDDDHHNNHHHASGATMSDSAPRLVSPVNRYGSNGEPPAVLGQAPEEDSAAEGSGEEVSIEEDSIKEEEPLKEEEDEESVCLSFTADEKPLTENHFGLYEDDQLIDHDHVVNNEDHDGIQQSQHGHPRTFIESPAWVWLETVNDESEHLIIPNAARLDRIMETLTSDTSSRPRRTKRVASTSRGQYRGAPDDQHRSHFGDLTRSVISKGNDFTQSIISKGKKKAGRSENGRYKFGDFTRGLMVVGANRER